MIGRKLQSTNLELSEEGKATAELPLNTTLNKGMYIIKANSRSANAQTRIIKE
jgi:hypothetical protein